MSRLILEEAGIHPAVRNCMSRGWAGIAFEGETLKPR
jgi:hypothetical protein